MARTNGVSPVVEIESVLLVSTEYLVVELEVEADLKGFSRLDCNQIVENVPEVPATRNPYCGSFVQDLWRS